MEEVIKFQEESACTLLEPAMTQAAPGGNEEGKASFNNTAGCLQPVLTRNRVSESEF